MLLTALRWLPVGVVAPLLVLVMTQRGLDLAQVGWVMLPYGIVVVVLELPTGGLTDSIGRRPVLLAATLTEAVAFGCYAFARTPLAFAVAGSLFGVARALHSGPLEAWYVDTVLAAVPKPEESAVRRGLAAAGTAEALALGVGALAGGVLPPLFATSHLDPSSARIDVFAVPFLAAAAISLVHAAAIAALVPDRAPVSAAHAIARLGPIRLAREGVGLAARNADLRRLLLAAGGVGLALTSFELFWQPRLVTLLGWRPEDATPVLGGLMGAVFLAAALGSSLAPRLARLLGSPVRAAVAGTLVHATSLLLAGLSASPVLSAVCFLAAYLANGWYWPLYRDLLHARVQAQHRAVMLSTSSLALQGGGIATKLTLAPLAAVAGIPTAWAVTAGLLVLCGVWVLRIPTIAGGALAGTGVPAVLSSDAEASRPG